MKITLKSLALSSAVLCATAAFAANQARVDVPFSFTAKGQAFPAGSYEVALDSNQNVVTMESNADATKHISWSVGPAEMINAPAMVKFDEVGSDHALRSIQVGARVTPTLDPQVKHGVAATTSIGGQ